MNNQKRICRYNEAIECNTNEPMLIHCLECLSVCLLERYHQIIETLTEDNPSMPHNTCVVLSAQDRIIGEIQTALYNFGKANGLKKLATTEYEPLEWLLQSPKDKP